MALLGGEPGLAGPPLSAPSRPRPSPRRRSSSGFLDALQAELRSLPRSRAEGKGAGAHYRGLRAPGPDRSGSRRPAPRAASERRLFGHWHRLARRARRFDPAVSTADILQPPGMPGRPCGLQMLLDRKRRDAGHLRLQHVVSLHRQLPSTIPPSPARPSSVSRPLRAAAGRGGGRGGQ